MTERMSSRVKSTGRQASVRIDALKGFQRAQADWPQRLAGKVINGGGFVAMISQPDGRVLKKS